MAPSRTTATKTNATPSPARTRSARGTRERVRNELRAEILDVAREHLAREGGTGLSLRSVARDMDMAPSALYRYFDGRDALLSALIISAFESLADAAEVAAEAAARVRRSDAERWAAVPREMRNWALTNPHQWGLIFGTPVPGYEAPQDTIEPYARIAAAMARPVHEAARAGPPGGAVTGAPTDPVPRRLRLAVAPVAEGLFPNLPVETAVWAVEAWSAIVGTISLEVFGHWRNTVLDPEALFEATVRDLARAAGLR